MRMTGVRLTAWGFASGMQVQASRTRATTCLRPLVAVCALCCGYCATDLRAAGPTASNATSPEAAAPTPKHAAPEGSDEKPVLTGGTRDGERVEAVEADAEDYAPPVPWLQTAKFVDYVRYTGAVRSLLIVDWRESAKGRQHAQAHVDAARALCRDDPRLPFAYGLFLWEVNDFEPAIAQFEEAARTGNVVLLPAVQAAAWGWLERHDVARGGRHLRKLAEILAAPEAAYPPPDQKQRDAEWLGRVIGYLRSAGGTDRNSEAVRRLETAISSQLAGTLRDAYDRGAASSTRLFADLTELASRSDDELRRELGERKQKVIDELTAVQTRLGTLQDQVRHDRDAAADSERNFRKASRALTGARHELADLPERIEYLSVPHGAVHTRIVPELTLKGRLTGRQELVQLPEREGQTVSRLRNRQRSIDLYNRLEGSLPKLKTDVDQAHGRMLDARKQNERTRRKLFPQIVELGHQETRLKSMLQHYEKWLQAPDLFKEHIRTLSPYVPWSGDQQKELLLESYRAFKHPEH